MHRGSVHFTSLLLVAVFAVPIAPHPSVSVAGNNSYASTISDSKPVVKATTSLRSGRAL